MTRLAVPTKVIAGLSSVAFVALSGCAIGGSGTGSGDAYNGITETYTFARYKQNFEGSVIVTLPARATNRSWFTNWIMLVARRPEQLSQPFVQVGEIRYLNAGQYPSAFVAFAMPGRALVYEDMGRVAEGEHTVRITGTARRVALYFDKRLMRVFDPHRFFTSQDATYFQFASEVKAEGDAPTGYLRDIRVKSDDDALPRMLVPKCVRYDRGLDLTIDGDRYVPHGIFVRHGKSGFRDC